MLLSFWNLSMHVSLKCCKVFWVFFKRNNFKDNFWLSISSNSGANCYFFQGYYACTSNFIVEEVFFLILNFLKFVFNFLSPPRIFSFSPLLRYFNREYLLCLFLKSSNLLEIALFNKCVTTQTMMSEILIYCKSMFSFHF